jgi:hypothetical protein
MFTLREDMLFFHKTDAQVRLETQTRLDDLHLASR